MTIIFQKGDEFWIEAHFIPWLALANNTSRQRVVPNDKAGELLGYCTGHTMEGDNVNISLAVRRINNLEPTLGMTVDGTTGLEIAERNEAGASQDVGALVIVFMRGAHARV